MCEAFYAAAAERYSYFSGHKFLLQDVQKVFMAICVFDNCTLNKQKNFGAKLKEFYFEFWNGINNEMIFFILSLESAALAQTLFL